MTKVLPTSDDARFVVPSIRSDWVPRPRLVAGLQSAGDFPVWVLAGAGYGKSTLLAQWANEDPRPAAWVRLSKMHNDPTVLMSDLTLAVQSVQPPTSRRSKKLTDPTLRNVLAGISKSFLLVLDDVHHIVGKESLEILRVVSEQVPPGSGIAFASRSEPALGLPRLRANRALVELGATDLATTDSEARELLRLVGIDVEPSVCEFLTQRTEGWPAGLYLAALRLRGVEDQAAAAKAFAGDDRNVVEYLRDELVHALPRKTVDFLVHTSVLERLSGPLCDAVLERGDSARLLEKIHDANLFLVPLDRNGEWYHCHNLFRDMLQSELTRRKPGVAARPARAGQQLVRGARGR